MREKVSSLIPKTEKHFLAAVAFFEKWRENISAMTGVRREAPADPLWARQNSEFFLYRLDTRDPHVAASAPPVHPQHAKLRRSDSAEGVCACARALG